MGHVLKIGYTGAHAGGGTGAGCFLVLAGCVICRVKDEGCRLSILCYDQMGVIFVGRADLNSRN